MAIHRGIVYPGRFGPFGEGPITVSRLVDAQVLRQTLRQRTDLDIVWIVSGGVYNNIVKSLSRELDPKLFHRTSMRIKGKCYVGYRYDTRLNNDQGWIGCGPSNGHTGWRDRLPSRPVEPDPLSPSLAGLLDEYQPGGPAETADLRKVRALAETVDDPWRRELPLHVTASALIVHPETDRVLLRWHQRQQAWLQVGGHGDPGESDPLAIARREAAEETGLGDLVPWPDAQLRHLVIVGVPAGKGEPAHEHADLRYFMATRTPEAARAENENAPLRWLSLAEAYEATSEVNLRESLARLERLLL